MGRKAIYSPEEARKRKRKQDLEYLRNLSQKQRERRRILCNIWQRKQRQKIKSETLSLLGNSCLKCGFSDPRALQIDHVHGKGNKELQKFRNPDGYYRFVLKQIKSGSKDYQLLCANCNWIKRDENKETIRIKEMPKTTSF